MDKVQMRDLMEHYGKLKGGLETCKGNIRRIKSSKQVEIIEANLTRYPLSAFEKYADEAEVYVCFSFLCGCHGPLR